VTIWGCHIEIDESLEFDTFKIAVTHRMEAYRRLRRCEHGDSDTVDRLHRLSAHLGNGGNMEGDAMNGVDWVEILMRSLLMGLAAAAMIAVALLLFAIVVDVWSKVL